MSKCYVVFLRDGSFLRIEMSYDPERSRWVSGFVGKCAEHLKPEGLLLAVLAFRGIDFERYEECHAW